MLWRKGFELRHLPSECVFRMKEKAQQNAQTRGMIGSKVKWKEVNMDGKKSLCYEICGSVIDANQNTFMNSLSR
jgi:hypothetical protein